MMLTFGRSLECFAGSAMGTTLRSLYPFHILVWALMFGLFGPRVSQHQVQGKYHLHSVDHSVGADSCTGMSGRSVGAYRELQADGCPNCSVASIPQFSAWTVTCNYSFLQHHWTEDYTLWSTSCGFLEGHTGIGASVHRCGVLRCSPVAM